MALTPVNERTLTPEEERALREQMLKESKLQRQQIFPDRVSAQERLDQLVNPNTASGTTRMSEAERDERILEEAQKRDEQASQRMGSNAVSSNATTPITSPETPIQPNVPDVQKQNANLASMLADKALGFGKGVVNGGAKILGEGFGEIGRQMRENPYALNEAVTGIMAGHQGRNRELGVALADEHDVWRGMGQEQNKLNQEEALQKWKIENTPPPTDPFILYMQKENLKNLNEAKTKYNEAMPELEVSINNIKQMNEVLGRFDTGWGTGAKYSFSANSPLRDNSPEAQQWRDDAAFIKSQSAFNVLQNIKRFLPGAVSDKESARVEAAFGNLNSPESEIRWATEFLEKKIRAAQKSLEDNVLEFGGTLPQRQEGQTQQVDNQQANGSSRYKVEIVE